MREAMAERRRLRKGHDVDHKEAGDGVILMEVRIHGTQR